MTKISNKERLCFISWLKDVIGVIAAVHGITCTYQNTKIDPITLHYTKLITQNKQYKMDIYATIIFSANRINTDY